MRCVGRFGGGSRALDDDFPRVAVRGDNPSMTVCRCGGMLHRGCRRAGAICAEICSMRVPKRDVAPRSAFVGHCMFGQTAGPCAEGQGSKDVRTVGSSRFGPDLKAELCAIAGRSSIDLSDKGERGRPCEGAYATWELMKNTVWDPHKYAKVLDSLRIARLHSGSP